MDTAFYRRWVVANGWAEAVGLGTTFAVGWMLAPAIGRMTGVAAVVGAAVLAIVLGALLEGVVVGGAQAGVLRQRLARVSPRAWTLATAAGAALAWALGMIPSTIATLTTSETNAPAQEPAALVQYLLAAGLGLVAGPVLGWAQWTVLRRAVPHAGRWLIANALAWAVGMPIIFAGMDRVPWSGSAAAIVACMYAISAAAGLVVGAIHGRTMARLLDAQQPA